MLPKFLSSATHWLHNEVGRPPGFCPGYGSGRLTLAALFAAFLILVTADSASAEDPVVVGMDVDAPGGLTVGDRVTYVVTLEADPGVNFSVVQSSLPAYLEVVGVPSVARESLDGGRVRTTFSFMLAAFTPGEIEVPPITLRFFGQDIPSGDLLTPESSFSVASVLPGGPDLPPPRDLKPQAVLGEAEPGWIMPALAGLAATLALVIIAIYVRSRLVRRRDALPEPAPVLSEEGPEDRARHVLDAAGANFSLDGDYVEYYSAIGVTVRRYLADRYGFPAFALTTRELEAEMLRRGLDRWQVRVAGGLLEQCDSVVYAHYRPAAERADADLTAAYEIVEMSRPQIEPEEVAAR